MGEDGWFFIEEASYKLLIETMLEEQQEGSWVGDDAGGSSENYGSLDELFDKKDCCKEEKYLQLEIDVEKHQGKKSQVDYDFIPRVIYIFSGLFLESVCCWFLSRAFGKRSQL